MRRKDMNSRHFHGTRGITTGCYLLLMVLLLPLHLHSQEELMSGTAHFTLKRTRGVSEADAQKVGDLLEKEYAAIAEKLKLPLPDKIQVNLYDSIGKFLSAAPGTRAWRGAVTIRNVIHVQPVRELEIRRNLRQALTYELAGIALEPVGKKGCPRWLSESFAVYESGELAGLTPPIGSRLAAFSDLNQDMQSFLNPPRLSDVHYLLGQTMTFLIQKYGEQKAFSVFSGFDGTTGVDKVFKNVFGDEYPAIEKSWARYIAFKTAPMK